jgi:type VI secretion system protein ImpC
MRAQPRNAMLGPDKARGASVSRERQEYRVEIDAGLGSTEPDSVSEPQSRGEAAFRIALLGDFSGHASRGALETGRALAARRPLVVDRDNIDDVIARIAPELHLPVGESRTTIRFQELEDFHPDRLYVRLPAYRALRETRERAAAPVAARDAGRQGARVETGRSPSSSSNLLDQILGDVPAPPGGTAATAPRVEPMRAAQPDALTDFVRRAVAPHIVEETVPAQPERVDEVDAIVADDLRAVLHHPAFRSLESAWRAVDFLVRRIETDRALQIHLVDVSKAELAADLDDANDLAATGAYRLLVESPLAGGGTPWALLVGLYNFRPEPSDVGLLRGMAAVARRAGAPFLASADSSFVGSPSFGTASDPDDWNDADLAEWDALRRSPDARYVGLAAPRFLLRLPYGGPDGEPCEVPAFTELSSADAHEEYLWGSSAVLPALLYAESFAADGPSLRPGLDVLGLPLHLVRADGEVRAKPCAEAILSARAVDRILERGVMAVQSQKDGDAVRLGRMQSIAEPLAALAVRAGDGRADG